MNTIALTQLLEDPALAVLGEQFLPFQDLLHGLIEAVASIRVQVHLVPHELGCLCQVVYIWRSEYNLYYYLLKSCYI